MSLTYGVAVLARPTFDVPFAEDMKTRAFAALEAAGIRTVGPRELLFDRAAAEQAISDIRAAGPIDLLLILQITFTDATMTVKLAKEATTPIAIWAVPEPRNGGRLRLNAYCGLNLAAHALGRAGADVAAREHPGEGRLERQGGTAGRVHQGLRGVGVDGATGPEQEPAAVHLRDGLARPVGGRPHQAAAARFGRRGESAGGSRAHRTALWR